MTAILLVCLGNICRSPTAEGVLQAKAAAAGLACWIDSAGTGGWHVGNAPDPRAIRAASARGYDLSALRARQISALDFTRFDLILAMDSQNLRDIETLRPRGIATPARLFLQDPVPMDVPDPYYDNSFGQMLDLIERGADLLLADLARGKRA